LGPVDEHQEPEAGLEPDEGYLSPSLGRLERSRRRGSPVRRIASGGPDPPATTGDPRQTDRAASAPALAPAADERRLIDLEARLAALEKRQAEPLPAPDDPRVADLEARFALLEDRQLELADNLIQAHEAFRRLAERVLALSSQSEPRPPREPS
jgi:hypothetical protein